MKAAIFTPVPYMGPAPRGTWPVPTSEFSIDVAEHSMATSLDHFELADQLGFDWVTVAEHHFAPMSLTPNPMIMAGALFALSNRVLDDTVANLGYYGRDVVNQRGRLQPHTLEDRIALGQLITGSPETVIRQIRSIRDELGCGVLDLVFQPVGDDKVRKAIELFGTKVLPRIREL